MTYPLFSWLLCHFVSVRYVFDLMEKTLNPIQKWLVTYTTLVPILHHCNLQVGHCCLSQGSLVGACLPPLVAEYLPEP